MILNGVRTHIFIYLVFITLAILILMNNVANTVSRLPLTFAADVIYILLLVFNSQHFTRTICRNEYCIIN